MKFNKFLPSFLPSFLILALILSSFSFNIHHASASGTIYYVDNTITDTHVASATADCTNYDPIAFTCSGGSASAYKTIADINVGTFSPDDQILFRKGQTWREQLTVPSSGSAGHPITFGSFGSGANPIISGANVVSGWGQGYTWSDIWTAFAQTGSTSWTSAGAGNFNFRDWIKTANITGTASTIRLGLAQDGGFTPIDSMYIGVKKTASDPFDFTSAPTQVMLGGSGTFTLTNGLGTVVYTDPVTFGIAAATDYQIAFHIATGGESARTNSGSGTNLYSLSGVDQSSVVDVSSYTSGTPQIRTVSSIQQGTAITNVYQAAVTVQPYIVMTDGAIGTNRASIGALVGDGDWFWSGGTLYLYSNTNPSGRIVEASTRNDVITDSSAVKNYITVNGLALQGSRTTGVNAVGTNWTISNCIITNLGGQQSGNFKGEGILATGASFAATGNTISNIIATGIEVSAAASPVITGNTISNSWDGVEYPSGHGAGIVLSGTTGAVVRNNMVTGNYTGIEDINASADPVVAYNVVANSHVNGLMHNTGLSGHPALYYNNTVIHNPSAQAGHCLTAEVSGDFWVAKNNLCYVNFTGTDTNVEAIAFDLGNYTSLDFDNNLYFLATGTTATTGEIVPTQYLTLAQWQAALAATSYSGKDAHSLNGDPLFTNFSSSNFTLQNSSPAIDTGVNLGSTYNQGLNPSSTWPSNVLTLNQDQNGSGWEIGAYVYPESTTLPVASSVSISGTTTVGQTLTGSYTYSDSASHAEATSTFRWLRASSSGGSYSPISGATSSTYILTSSDIGQYLEFEVTPVSTIATGIAVTSSASSQVPSNVVITQPQQVTSGGASAAAISKFITQQQTTSPTDSSITPPTTSTQAYNFGTTTLKNGSRGSSVKELQRFLNNNLNLGLKLDGILGSKTIAVIKTWQKAHGLVADGLVGVKTKAVMNAGM